jgi:hypothetical protein
MGGEINRHFAGARHAFRLIDPLTLDQLAAGSIPEHFIPLTAGELESIFLAVIPVYSQTTIFHLAFWSRG